MSAARRRRTRPADLLLMRPDGTKAILTAAGLKFTLEELQAHVAGEPDTGVYVETLRSTDFDAAGGFYLVFDENGREAKLPLNQEATEVAADLCGLIDLHLVGNVLKVAKEFM